MFALIAAVPLVVGTFDLLTAQEFPSKALALLLVAAGATPVTAAGTILARSNPARVVGVIGGLGGVIASGTFLELQYTTGNPTIWLYVWWISLGVSLVSIVVWGKGGGFARLKGAPWKTVGAVLSSAALSGVIQFWYTTYEKPSRTAPFLKFTDSLRQLKIDRELTPIEVSVAISNVTDARVQVLGSLYVARGVTVRPAPDPGFPLKIQSGVTSSIFSSSGTPLTTASSRVIQAGPLMPVGEFFDANTNYDTRFLIYVPMNYSFSHIAIEFTLLMAQGLRLHVERPLFGPQECVQTGKMMRPQFCPNLARGVAANITTWRIPTPTLVARLTSASRYVTTAVVQQNPAEPETVPRLAVEIDKGGGVSLAPSDEAEKIAAYYEAAIELEYAELELTRASP
jgi:hypothetical protein